MMPDVAVGGPAEPLLERVSALLADRLGLHYPKDRWRDMAKALAAAAPELGCKDAHACVERLLSAPPERADLDVLAQYLTVGETYFFRDPAAFALLRTRILPEIVQARSSLPRSERRLRIWSAGCSTGEEAYSIAMTVESVLPDPPRWQVHLLATDVNPGALERARKAVYTAWSFRGPGRAAKDRHFRAIDEGRYALDPALRDRVTFARLNLVDDVYPGLDTQTNAMDVIFCRNVLMYLRPDQASAAVGRFERCLVPGGWLVVSPVEASMVATPSLVALRLPEAQVFRKTDVVARAAPRVLTRATPRPAPARLGACAAHAAPAGPQGSQPATAAFGSASALYALGRYGEAAAVLRALLDAEPDHGEALTLLVRSLANQGELAEALAWSERAVARDRLDPARSYLQASVLLEQGQTEQAADAYRRSLYLDPHSAMAHFALANLLAGQGREGEARRHYRAARDVVARMPPDAPLREAEGLVAGRLARFIDEVLGGAEEGVR